MAFFSLTSVGHQDPFIGRKLQPATVESSEEELERKEELDPGKLPPISPAADTADSYPHQGSQETNKEMMKRDQQMKSPYHFYNFPLSYAQQYGWWMSRYSKIQEKEPWMRSPRYPRIWSPMSKFVDDMAKTNPNFSFF
ncbi:testis-expressed protein 49 isoform X1 [Rhinatrema bivittatum]|uniref:testis-expressed protein 49 isoform X1 n=1 Tax=Rhinatrema bivittatum TaxID=194408 RepID=UPI001127B8B0|nr:testis-expressed protein 49 isoform X1 [Rhinatrema bivittatum]